MKPLKGVLIFFLVIIVGVGGWVAYKSMNVQNTVKLKAFNSKEDSLTKESESVYSEIQAKYKAMEQGDLKPEDFKKEMVPLSDKMKANWDDYNQYTKEHELKTSDRDSKVFKDGVSLASNIRFNIYAFLINVTQQNLTKKQIEEKYKNYLAQVDSKLKQYKEMTKELK